MQKSVDRPTAADVLPGAADSALQLLEVDVAAAEFPEHPNPHLKVAIVLESAALDVRWQSAGGRTVSGVVARGSSSVMPAALPYSTHWRSGGQMLLMSFSAAFLSARSEALGARASELQPAWSQPDTLLPKLAMAVRSAQHAGLATTAYLDAAAEIALVHLYQRYGVSVEAHDTGLVLVPRRLTPVLELIEAHLGEDLSQARLAAAAGLSTHGFARAFRRAVGEPPHRYILRRRCAHACRLLRQSSIALADIAAALGFSSQAHFTTAFRHATGITPARCRARHADRLGPSKACALQGQDGQD